MTGHKNFRELRKDLTEGPEKPELAGDSEGGDINDQSITASTKKSFFHIRQFTKHPVAGDHQFNGSREAVGVSEEVEEGVDENFNGPSKIIDDMFKKNGGKMPGVKNAGAKGKRISKAESDKRIEANKKIKLRGHKEKAGTVPLRGNLHKLRSEEAIEEMETQSKAFEDIAIDHGISLSEDDTDKLIATYQRLNKANQAAFVSNLQSGEGAFSDMVDFSQGVE